MNTLFVLVHSPLVGPATWAPVAQRLAERGVATIMPVLRDDDQCGIPYWRQHAESCVRALAATPAGQPLVLVGHSGAGPLLPAIAGACGHPVAAYLFADAGLPMANASRLQAIERELPGVAAALRHHLEAGGRFPEWTDEDLREVIPDQRTRGRVLAELRPRSLAFFEEAIPGFAGGPDAPCGYLKFSEAYAQPAAQARSLGWPVEDLAGQHFHMLVDPSGVADAVTDLARDLI